MSTMEEFGRRYAVRGALLYFATPSALSMMGEHAQHIEQMRLRAISVGVEPAVADSIIAEVKAEAATLPYGTMAWMDDQIADRLFDATVLFDPDHNPDDE